MDNHENQEKVSMFVSVTGTDPEFAASFLECVPLPPAAAAAAAAAPPSGRAARSACATLLS
jgi:hypothetical protein